jgi:hypothetical protein
MKIDIENPNRLLSLFLLENVDIVNSVAETKELKDNGRIIATVKMNGVEVPAEVMENVLQNLINQVEEHYREQYNADAFDKRVEDRAEQILKEHADNVLEKLYSLSTKLEESDSLIKPYWKR